MTSSYETGVRKLLQLMRDSCLLSGSAEEKRRMVVSGLGGLIGADFAEWTEFSCRDRVPRAKVELRLPCQPTGELLFSRRSGEPFSERDINLASWLAAEFPWAQAHAVASLKGLARRERLILDLLLQGYGRKEIAERLGLSLNTVQGYTKAVYRHFDVHSHAELLRHYFLTRAFEDRPALSLAVEAKAV